ncbi:hypothetical protein FGO68_gene3520 [Halteria grandinella]|uniref:TRP C-terminal domain-containing protein n=1 Tax=Halteria grandinella TaxID=5974 RepID=A0A8J8P562_HALGN|nr:hypothetical protein FGO68_gene3520 [Halteria grandinella]
MAIANQVKDTDIKASIVDKSDVNIRIEKVLDGGILLIQLEFVDRGEISSANDLDEIQVIILSEIASELGNSNALLSKGSMTSAAIPLQYSLRQQQIVDFLLSSEVEIKFTFLAISIFLQLFVGFAMNLIWEMMNDLSFLISLGLVSIPIPGVASQIQSLLSSIIYLDLLLTDKWLIPWLDLAIKEEELEEDAAMNIFFESQGFQSMLLMYNLGSTSAFIILQITIILLTSILGILSLSSQRAKQLYAIIHPKVFWAGTIRFIIQQFQPLQFASLINIKSTSISGFNEQSHGIQFNLVASIGLFAFTLVSIPVFYRIIKSGKTDQERFSVLIEGLKSSNRGLAVYWTVWTLIKWSLMCIILVCLTSYPFQQLQLLSLLSFLSITLQFKVKPQDSKVENLMGFFNELITIIYLYTLIGLANASDNFQLRENLGLVLIALLLFALFANVLKVFIMIGIELVKWLRKKCISRDGVTVLRKHVRKYTQSMLTIQEQEEEVKDIQVEEKQLNEQVFHRYVRRKKISISNTVHNETSLPTTSLSTSMMIGQDITIQELS